MHSPYYIAQQRRDHYDDPFIDFVPQQLDKKRHMLSFWWNKRRKRHHFKALKVKGPGLNQEYEYAVSMLVLYKGTVQNLVECFCKAMFCNYKFQFCPHIFVFIFLKTCKRIHKNVLYFYQQLYQWLFCKNRYSFFFKWLSTHEWNFSPFMVHLLWQYSRNMSNKPLHHVSFTSAPCESIEKTSNKP